MSREPQATKKLQAKLRLLPDAPGVYLYKNNQGKVLYVGKASRLNQRVRSYFRAGGDPDAKTLALVRKIRDLDYIVTDSSTDALVLENQLIKEYRPLYNVRLKDDKQYPYLRVSLAEPYPRISVVRRLARDGARYFGPFTDVGAMRETLKFAAGTFQVRTCHLDLPGQTVARPCLDWQIGRCGAPCVDYDTREDYLAKVRQLVLFLSGTGNDVLEELRAAMGEYSAGLQFEEAARVRDLIAKLDRTISRSRPIAGIKGDCDLIGVAREGQDASGVVLRVRGGHILTTHHFLMSAKLDSGLDVFMAQLLREYYPRAGDIPREILLSHPVEQHSSWQEWLAGLRAEMRTDVRNDARKDLSPAKIILKHPRRGAKKEAVELAHTNAAFKLREVDLRRQLAKPRKMTPGDIQLQEALDLHSVPETIECFDISNFQGKETVASLVFFKGGRPLKSRYRRFRVKTVRGIDDLASMKEVLTRYYGRLVDKGIKPADLVVVDGGAGQLGVAREVLAAYGCHETQLIGLAKREETIHREGGTLDLTRDSEALKLLQRVRDEAHRFAITYHRLLRDRKTTASELDLIPGIGLIKKLSLLHGLGSVARIRAASAKDLAQVRGINRHDVVAIREFFAKRPEPEK